MKFYILNEKEGAFEDYTKAIEVAPTNARFYYERAKRYYLMHDIDAALQDMKLAVKYDPERISYKNILENWTENHNIAPEEIENDEKYFDDNLKTFRQMMSDVRGEIFGMDSPSNPLLMTIFPMPDSFKDFLTGNKTLSQIINDTPAIRTAYNNAEEQTIQVFNDISSHETVIFFLFNLSKELNKIKLPAIYLNALIEKTRVYMIKQLPEEVQKKEAAKYAMRAEGLADQNAPFEQIVEFYDLAIELDKNNAKYYTDRAFYESFINLQKAKKDYEKAIMLDPFNEEFRKEYGLFLDAFKENLGIVKSIKSILSSIVDKAVKTFTSVPGKKEVKPLSKKQRLAKAEDFAKKAYEKLIKGYYSTALAYYNEAITLDPKKAEYYFERAITEHQGTGDYDKAVDDYISAMDLDPENADFYEESASQAISVKQVKEEEVQSYIDFARQQIEMENFEEAMKAYSEAIKITPKNGDLYSLRASLEVFLDNHDAAFKDINMALFYSPENAKYYFARGNIRILLSDIRGALEDFNKAIELDYEKEHYYISRATVKYLLGDSGGALMDYGKAIIINDENPDYFVMRANLEVETNDPMSALKDFNSAIELQKELGYEDPEVYTLRAAVKYGLEDYEGALEDYDIAIDLDPEEPSYYKLRAIAKDGLEDYEGAIEDYDKAIEFDSEDPDLYYGRALVKSSLEEGEFDPFEDYDMAIELDPLNDIYYHGRGLAYQEEGNYKAALEDYNNAIALNEGEAEYYFTRAILYREYKQYKKALEDFNTAIKINHEDPEFYYERGLLKEEMHKYSEALEDYKTAVKLDPTNEDYLEKLRDFSD